MKELALTSKAGGGLGVEGDSGGSTGVRRTDRWNDQPGSSPSWIHVTISYGESSESEYSRSSARCCVVPCGVCSCCSIKREIKIYVDGDGPGSKPMGADGGGRWKKGDLEKIESYSL